MDAEQIPATEKWRAEATVCAGTLFPDCGFCYSDACGQGTRHDGILADSEAAIPPDGNTENDEVRTSWLRCSDCHSPILAMPSCCTPFKGLFCSLESGEEYTIRVDNSGDCAVDGVDCWGVKWQEHEDGDCQTSGNPVIEGGGKEQKIRAWKPEDIWLEGT